MLSTGTQAAEFIKVLRPTLDSAGLHSVGINCCEATGWNVAKQHAAEIRAAGAEDMVYAMASHEYTSPITGVMDTTARVWQTEYSDLTHAWSTQWYTNGSAGDGYTWANTIFNGIVNSNLNAYIFWEGVQDRPTNGNNNEKLILIDGQNYEVSKRLWAFAQWRVVRPGAVRVGTTSSTPLLKTAAFKNIDGSLAIVIINTSADAQVASLGMASKYGVAEAWYTDEDSDMTEIAVTTGMDGSPAATVPPRGIISFLFSNANGTLFA